MHTFVQNFDADIITSRVMTSYIFFYKHNVYKHTEAQISKKTKHILSVFLSLIFVY